MGDSSGGIVRLAPTLIELDACSDNLRQRSDLLKWYEWLRKLDEFKELNGHCNVLQSVKGIGPWVNRQRRERKMGKLSNGKIDALNALGFSWEQVKRGDEKWDLRFKQFLEVRKFYGVVKTRPDSILKVKRVGRWITEQRREYKSLHASGKQSSKLLTLDRIQRLNEVGFEWSGQGKQKTRRHGAMWEAVKRTQLAECAKMDVMQFAKSETPDLFLPNEPCSISSSIADDFDESEPRLGFPQDVSSNTAEATSPDDNSYESDLHSGDWLCREDLWHIITQEAGPLVSDASTSAASAAEQESDQEIRHFTSN